MLKALEMFSDDFMSDRNFDGAEIRKAAEAMKSKAEDIKQVADAADMIVNGYAFTQSYMDDQGNFYGIGYGNVLCRVFLY